MKQRPILFSGPMVRAILEGRKTQTRRVVKPQPDDDREMKARLNRQGNLVWMDWKGKPDDAAPPHYIWGAGWDRWKCPYGQPGDRLWVRECFSYASFLNDGVQPLFHYWADGNPEEGDWTKPKPSIHMPRAASRITLEIVSVRVERLMDISMQDCIAEGAPMERIEKLDEQDQAIELRCWYENLWEEINGIGSYYTNPWVWVVEFKVV
jgi:hypothetical protein